LRVISCAGSPATAWLTAKDRTVPTVRNESTNANKKIFFVYIMAAPF